MHPPLAVIRNHHSPSYNMNINVRDGGTHYPRPMCGYERQQYVSILCSNSANVTGPSDDQRGRASDSEVSTSNIKLNCRDPDPNPKSNRMFLVRRPAPSHDWMIEN